MTKVKRSSRHGLKFQLLLVLKLFVACIVASIYLTTQRAWVEDFMKERYAAPPNSLQSVVDAITMRQPFQRLLDEIPVADRIYLYDFWMATEPIHSDLPRRLMELDSQTFLKRAERTLIGGSPEQRKKALTFFRLSGEDDAIPILEKARRWAERRAMHEFAEEIGSVINHLKA